MDETVTKKAEYEDDLTVSTMPPVVRSSLLTWSPVAREQFLDDPLRFGHALEHVEWEVGGKGHVS